MLVDESVRWVMALANFVRRFWVPIASHGVFGISCAHARWLVRIYWEFGYPSGSCCRWSSWELVGTDCGITTMGCLERIWTEATQMAVTPSLIVKRDVVCDIQFGRIPLLVGQILGGLLLQAREEGSGHGVIPAVAS
jgi:hypothetical protein